MTSRSDSKKRNWIPGKALGTIDFAEKVCPICGKTFIPAPQHALTDKKTGKYVCSCSCSEKSRKSGKSAIQNMNYRKYPPIIVNGVEYEQGGYINRSLNVSGVQLIKARENGLPYIKRGKYYYYNTQDVLDYLARKNEREKKCKENNSVKS